jgi:hypothetical protein
MKQLRARELEPATKPEDCPSEMRVTPKRTVATITNPSLIAVMIFTVIGCLIVLNVVFRFPDLGLTVEQFNLFAGF